DGDRADVHGPLLRQRRAGRRARGRPSLLPERAPRRGGAARARRPRGIPAEGTLMRAGAVVAGIGESAYFERGKSPLSEVQLALVAIRAACADAGLAPADVDGFVSYMDQRNDPLRLSAALGVRSLSWTSQPWGGGGNNMAAAVQLAAAAVSAGYARHVVAFRALAQGQFGR